MSIISLPFSVAAGPSSFAMIFAAYCWPVCLCLTSRTVENEPLRNCSQCVSLLDFYRPPSQAPAADLPNSSVTSYTSSIFLSLW